MLAEKGGRLKNSANEKKLDWAWEIGGGVMAK
jgi:hypothetical protein